MLRVVTLNLWGEQGPLAARFPLVDERAPGALTPDVVLLQEVRQVPGRVPNQGATLAAALRDAGTPSRSPRSGAMGKKGSPSCRDHPLTDPRHHVELPHAVPNERRIVLAATAHTRRPGRSVSSPATSTTASPMDKSAKIKSSPPKRWLHVTRRP